MTKNGLIPGMGTHNNAHSSYARKFAVSTCWQKMVNTYLAEEETAELHCTLQLKLLAHRTFKNQTKTA